MTMGATDYFITDAAGDPCETVPESSRRARVIPVWAVLRALGRQGVADLVDGFCRHAQAFADGIRADVIACGATSVPAFPNRSPCPPMPGHVTREFIRGASCSLLIAPSPSMR